MQRSLSSRWLIAGVAGLAALISGCTPEAQILVVQCSTSNPYGECAAGQTCFQGGCVATSTLCSPTNDTGVCPSNTSCFGGGCVPTSKLCSSTNPTGPCETGKTCFSGACTLTASLCSTSNTTGTCPAGQTCQAGVCAAPQVDACTVKVYTTQPTVAVAAGTGKTIITADGLQFRDSSGDGTLQPYEDWRLNELCRAKDLVGRMSIPEKIGLMSEGGTVGSGSADAGVGASVVSNIQTLHLRQGLIRLGSFTGAQLAAYLNTVQRYCEAEPWGIPFVITTDPSHGFGMDTNATTGVQTISASAVVSPWPYPLGLGAINDVAVTRQYGDTVRKEFSAMGFRWQLGPMADVATEPRWARVQNTFGENAFAVANHTRACIQGFQGDGVGGLKGGGIAATVKHFPGAGADEDGKDSHSRPGKYNVYPGNNFKYHQIAFKAAFDVGAAALMPCYSIFKSQLQDPEQTGAALSKTMITDYLKGELGFSGMITGDWGAAGGSAWGAEALTAAQKAAMFVKAGSHQLGNDSMTNIQAAYDQGLLTDADINAAAVKILEMSFKLGIFENPYNDVANAAAVLRSAENRTNGFVAQKKAIVFLKNAQHEGGNARYLPIDPTRTTTQSDGGVVATLDTNKDGTVSVYYDGVVDGLTGTDIYSNIPGVGDYDYTAAAVPSTDGGFNVPAVARATTAATADVAVVRISARKGTYFGLDEGVPLSFDAPFPGLQTDGALAASIKDRNRVIDLLRIRDGYTDSTGTPVAATNPTLRIVLVMHMDRPGIVKPFVNGLVNLNETAGVPGSYPLVSNPANIRADGLGGVDALLAEFGAYDRAILDVVFNKNIPTSPTGYKYGQARLPMEIPSSDADVAAQFEDMPADTWNPTYALGAGSGY